MSSEAVAGPPDDGADGMRAAREVHERWQAEPEDSGWTHDTRRYLIAALNDLEIGGELVEASCRKSLCKLQLRFESAEEAARFGAGASDGRAALAIRAEERDGALNLELFLPRAKAPP